jgi:hypothetical protein
LTVVITVRGGSVAKISVSVEKPRSKAVAERHGTIAVIVLEIRANNNVDGRCDFKIAPAVERTGGKLG